MVKQKTFTKAEVLVLLRKEREKSKRYYEALIEQRIRSNNRTLETPKPRKKTTNTTASRLKRKKLKATFEVTIIKHKKYYVIRNRNGKIIDRQRYSKKNYDTNFQLFKKNRSLSPNVKRKELHGVTMQEQVVTRTNVKENGQGIKTGSRVTRRRTTNKKDINYGYVITARNRRTGKEEVVIKGHNVKGKIRRSNGEYTERTREEARADAYKNFYSYIQGHENGGDYNTSAQTVLDRKGWDVEESVIWYDFYK